MRRRALRWSLAAVALASAAAPGEDFDHRHAAYNAVLEKHVAGGLVDYRGIKADPRPLDEYLEELAAVEKAAFEGWGEERQMAFLVNLYNAATLRLVARHYPVGSIREIGRGAKGPWDLPVVRLFGQRITLNNLEHDILRKRYDEPRLHMALVCAAVSCPPLRGDAYTGEQLDAQLDEQSRVFLAGGHGLEIDPGRREVRVSAIFKWYAKDFPSVRDFVARHSGRSLRKLKIRYLDYDWSINAQAAGTP